jgi:hypothetical protein
VIGRAEDGSYIRCRREFVGFTSGCPECTEARRRQRAVEARARRVAKLASRRQATRDQLRCATCSDPVWSAKRSRSGAAYCSSLCRQKAYRRRRLAQVPDPR